MAESHTITIAQIAHRLGVSETTVCLVLAGRGKRYRISQATIDRVTGAAEELGYRPNLVARQLTGKRSNVVGVLINTEAVADVRLIQAMEILAAGRGLRFMVGHAVGTPEQVREYVADFQARGVDGIISVFHNHPDFRDTVLPELAGVANVVYFERPDAADAEAVADAWYVEPDYYRVGQLGVQHLLDRGRRRIGLVLNDRIFSYAVHRHQAFLDTLGQAGQADADDLVWVLSEQEGAAWTDPFTDELALEVVEDLVVNRGADGLVVVNDWYAARLVRALHERGRKVPADVAVVGCDNLEFGPLMDPALTTLDLHTQELARAMMKLVFSQLDDEALSQPERQLTVLPELIVRETT